MLRGKVVEATTSTGAKAIRGRVILVYSDAVRSGTTHYVRITYLMIRDQEGNIHQAYPRNVTKVSDEY